MKNAEQLLDNEAEVLSFLRTRLPLHHLSNVFFRDLQYGLQAMLERKGVKVGYTDAERIALDFAKKLEKKKMFVPIDSQSWVLHNEEYKTVSARKPAPAKPAAEKPAAAKPAGALPPLKSASPAGGTKPAAGLPPLKSAVPAGGAKPAQGLPPLKSAAPVGGAKPAAGLPPLKSSAPSGTAQPSPAPVPAQPAAKPVENPPVPEAQTARPAPAPKPATPAAKGGLPPITSSVPAGKK